MNFPPNFSQSQSQPQPQNPTNGSPSSSTSNTPMPMPMNPFQFPNPNMNMNPNQGQGPNPFAAMFGNMGGMPGNGMGMGGGGGGGGGMPPNMGMPNMNMQQMQQMMGGMGGMNGMGGMGGMPPPPGPAQNGNNQPQPQQQQPQQPQQPQNAQLMPGMPMGMGMNGMNPNGMGGMDQMFMLFTQMQQAMQSNPQFAPMLMMQMQMMGQQAQQAQQAQQQQQAQQAQHQQQYPGGPSGSTPQTPQTPTPTFPNFPPTPAPDPSSASTSNTANKPPSAAVQTALSFRLRNQPPTNEQAIALLYDVSPQLLQSVFRLTTSAVGSKDDDERVLVEALWRAGKGGNGEGVDYGKALRGLHGVNDHATNHWQAYYCTHQTRIDALVASFDPSPSARVGARSSTPSSASGAAQANPIGPNKTAKKPTFMSAPSSNTARAGPSRLGTAIRKSTGSKPPAASSSSSSRPSNGSIGPKLKKRPSEAGGGGDGGGPEPKKARTLEEELSQQSVRSQIHNERVIEGQQNKGKGKGVVRNGSGTYSTPGNSPVKKKIGNGIGNGIGTGVRAGSSGSSTVIERPTPSNGVTFTGYVTKAGLREPTPPKEGMHAVWTDEEEKYVIDFVEWNCEVYKEFLEAGGAKKKTHGGWANRVNRMKMAKRMEERAPWHSTGNYRQKTYELWPTNQKIKNTQEWAENLKAQNKAPSAEVESEDGEGESDGDEQEGADKEHDESMYVDGDEGDASSDEEGPDGVADHVAAVKVDPIKALAEYISLYDEVEWLAFSVKDRWETLLEKYPERNQKSWASIFGHNKDDILRQAARYRARRLKGAALDDNANDDVQPLPLDSDDMPFEEPPVAGGQSQSESQARLSPQVTPSAQPGPGVRVGLEAGGGTASADNAMNVDGPQRETSINGSVAPKGPGQASGSQSRVGSNANSPVVQNDPEMVARIRQRLSASNGLGV